MIITLLLSLTSVNSNACTSFILKAKDGSIIYARTLEWGAFDAESEFILFPRNLEFTSDLGEGVKGMSWKNKYGFVAINGMHKPLYLDGLNEAGLSIGTFYLPGFAKYQSSETGKESSTITNLDLIPFILSQFTTVVEIKKALPEIIVIYNTAFEKESKTPTPLHYVATDCEGNSIVIEYVEGKLNIHDNEIGVMTNSPAYDWHIENLRNYNHLTPYGSIPGSKTVDGVNFSPFGAGAGLNGIPGSYTPPSRFIRAFFFTQTSVPLKNADEAINQASRILNNFDIPKGCVREGTPEEYSLGYTQWSAIVDIKNRKYYWWTEWNRQMRMVDLNTLDFDGDKAISIPLDKERVQNIDNRSGEFSQ